MIQKPQRPDVSPQKTFTTPQINYKTAIAGILLALLLGGVAKWCGFTNTESIGAFAAVIASVALIYNAMHLENNYKNNDYKIEIDSFVHQRKYELDKKIVAINIITEWYKDFRGESRTVKKLKDDHYTTKPQLTDDELVKVINGEIKMTIDDETDYKKPLIALLNYFEKIAIAILTETADEQILKEYFEDMFVNYFEVFKPYILSRRKGAGALKSAFDNFEQVALSWTPRKKA